MKKWLFNPFVYVAGERALFIGIVAMMATAVVGYFSHTHFDGVLDIHNGRISPIGVHIAEQVIDWLCLTIVLYIGGLIFSSSKIRLIDVAGTMALARWVMIFPAIIGFGIHMPAEQPKMVSDALKLVTPSMVALSLLDVVFSIWMVALLYNAFSVSCNMKGGKSAGVFIAGLAIAEIAAWFIIHKFVY
jgi:hypothetical protein